MEFHRVRLRRLVATALFGDDVQDDGLLLVLEELEGLDEEIDVVTIDRSVVVHPEFLEEHVGEKQVFRAAFHLRGDVADRFSGDALDELGRLLVDVGVGRARLESVEIFRDGADIAVDRPLVVVQHEDEAFR